MMKRMHPAYVLTQLPRFFWLLVLPLMRRLIEWKNIGLAGKLPLLIAVFLIFAAAFLRWQTQRWAIRGNALLLSNGLFFRRQFRIPFPLIAAVRESRGPLLRLFGAQRIQIETAASRKAAQSMTLYLGKHEAEALLTAYAGEGSFQPVSRMRVRDTLLAALSTSNFALGLFAAAPVLRGAGNLFGTLVQERLWGVLTSAQRLAAAYVPPMLTAIALLALLGWALHVLKLLEQYHRFTLLQNSTSLATRSGLIVKRRLLMRHARLSAFTIRQTPPGSGRCAVCGPYWRAWRENPFDAGLPFRQSKKSDPFAAKLLPGDHSAHPAQRGVAGISAGLRSSVCANGRRRFRDLFHQRAFAHGFLGRRRSFTYPDFVLLPGAAEGNTGGYFFRPSGRPHGQRLFRMVSFLFAGRAAGCAGPAIARAGKAPDLHCAGVLLHNTGGTVFTASPTARFI